MVAGSIVDYLGVSGGMSVLVPFDIDHLKVKYMLQKTDAAVLAGKEVPFWVGENGDQKRDKGQPSEYFKSLSTVLDLAKEKNTANKYYPVLALGKSLNAMILNLASDKENLQVCKEEAKFSKKIQLTKEFDSSVFWNKIGIRESKEVFAKDAAYFEVGCYIPYSKFKADQRLTDNFNVLGLVEMPGGESAVGLIEHKSLPFYGALFRAEKNAYERGDIYASLDRSEDTVQLFNDMIATITYFVRKSGSPKEYKHISSQLKQYFGTFRPAEMPFIEEYERIYTFQRFNKQP